MKSRFVYGPVPSRRLGRSRGVDLVPFKSCSYDCIYCQLGRTTNRTTERREYVPVDAVLDELAARLREGARPDYIGLAGSGEPTLHARLGDIIGGIKALTGIPVAVMTNGSLLWMPEVRAGLAQADLVLPSLDAGAPPSFERVNRPHADISFERMVEGLLAFGRDYKGQVWLEVFVLGGITDRPDELGRVAAVVDRLRPAKVQLNTLARPSTEPSALAVPRSVLESLCGLFPVPCEIIAESAAAPSLASAGSTDVDHEILSLLARRPCTVEGVALGLGRPANEVLKHLEALCAAGTLHVTRRGEAVFYERTRGG
jgi:wyosine [tRNA(Phe)-imidazoG37] synthetase (radical SAM superfamily)